MLHMPSTPSLPITLGARPQPPASFSRPLPSTSHEGKNEGAVNQVRRKKPVVLDDNENKLLFRKKEFQSLLVYHTPARTKQKLASAVMTYFEDMGKLLENFAMP
ncbi:hypothetical protein EVAR_44050_1 [Eumeta japonica]|uniref:Uncharacterized protein n=1 Tax=Eumeta variegata TaxID=151549 RepID=A0A4C1XL37_EUMVA|nr:hypothetical protein EVAR_44050_1 [Eumeta japonica]